MVIADLGRGILTQYNYTWGCNFILFIELSIIVLVALSMIGAMVVCNDEVHVAPVNNNEIGILNNNNVPGATLDGKLIEIFIFMRLVDMYYIDILGARR